ncbi:MAG TPA: type I polyketide synthase, partial [Planctomycetota bacterium]|nr:type I polyketide synthase [Planctomycetota bacterium]
PRGGRHGLGIVRGELDIAPGDWFLACHFIDDRVMPGTLMYECGLHAMRVLLLRLGWIAERGAAAFEPVPGVRSRLKCRGQVLESTRTLACEVVLKEIGDRPAPFAIADALLFADGKPIVEVTDMSLRLSGVEREDLERVWREKGRAAERSPPEAGPGRKPAVFGNEKILAFAVGKPSEAFGEPYRVFDEERVIARLPGPPYKFLDRITAVRAAPWILESGGEVEAQYDVPPDAWYLGESGCGSAAARMPFAVLLEVALQPCGWLAAYAGSALTSPVDLRFRNLGGEGVQLRAVTPASETLTTAVKLTSVSSASGMIIEHYDLDVRDVHGPVYRGKTYFGFFSVEALSRQVGIRDAGLHRLTPEEETSSGRFAFPEGAPFPGAMLRMVDRITEYVPNGGPRGLGFVRGEAAVNPSAWFFAAHFFQDPVWPGSLGLESHLQLLEAAAARRWGTAPGVHFESMVPGAKHSWVYRGQVVPADHTVTVEAVITEADDARRILVADGFLSVDGRVIYQMKGFALRLHSKE